MLKANPQRFCTAITTKAKSLPCEPASTPPTTTASARLSCFKRSRTAASAATTRSTSALVSANTSAGCERELNRLIDSPTRQSIRGVRKPCGFLAGQNAACRNDWKRQRAEKAELQRAELDLR